jgi:hypothetical protein
MACATIGARAHDANADFANRLVATKLVVHKAFACFVRRDDVKHLARHPQQKVSAMKLLVSVEQLPEDEQLHYAFRLGVKLRKQPGNFATSGDCGHPAAEVAGGSLRIHCSVDCDGGGIEASLADGDKAVLVKLDEIRLDPAEPTNQASIDDDPDHDGHVMLRAGADDRVFRLDRTDIADCKSLASADDELAALADK